MFHVIVQSYTTSLGLIPTHCALQVVCKLVVQAQPQLIRERLIAYGTNVQISKKFHMGPNMFP